MTDDERDEFERLKQRVAELEARPRLEDSAIEKWARLQLAATPQAFQDEGSVAAHAKAVWIIVPLLMLAVLAALYYR